MKTNRGAVDTALVPGVGRVPIPAYRGQEPYIFLSYAHKNAPAVYEQIQLLNELGYRVWYDEGIAPGNEWTDEIAAALERCALFLVLITPDSAQSENVQNEINFALDEKKPFLAVHLQETELKGGVKLQIGAKQAILRYTMSQEEYVFKLTSALERMGMHKTEGGRAEAPAPMPAAPGKKRLPLALLAPLAVLILGGIVFFALRGGQEPALPAPTDAPVSASTEDPAGQSAGLHSMDGFYYVVSGDHVEITGFDAVLDRLEAPAQIEGLPVTSIARQGNFYTDSTRLTSVSLPDSVTVIAPYTFANSPFLADVVLPEGLKEIGDGAFYNCTRLAELRLPETLEKIGSSAFMNCDKLALGSLPEGLKEIGSYAFYNCQALTNIALPDGLAALGAGAFGACTGLKSAHLPQGLPEIPGYLFQSCAKLTSVNVPEGVTGIGEWAFYGCIALTKLTLPDSLVTIDEYAFYGCSKLSDLTLPPSLRYIGDNAFTSCGHLTEVRLPEGLTSVGSSAFAACQSLKTVSLPLSLTEIGVSAFEYCNSLSNVYYAGTQAQWEAVDVESLNEPLTQAAMHFAP